MKYKTGDKVRIKENYIISHSTAAFNTIAEQKIKQIDRIATISACSKECSYDKNEPGYRFKEISGLVFRESSIENLIDELEMIKTRFEILDL